VRTCGRWPWRAVGRRFWCLPRVRRGAGGRAAAVAPGIGGVWTGAKLRCQKEEGKLVRCGTPTPFEITFADDGTDPHPTRASRMSSPGTGTPRRRSA